MEYLFRVKDTVEKFLRKFPILRDDDNRLIANVWHQQLKKMGLTEADCLNAVAKGLLVTPESIVRSRRKLQESNPKYRGTKWEDRKKRGNKIKKEIKF